MTQTAAVTTAWPLHRTCPMSQPPALAAFRDGPPRQVLLRGDQPAWLITRYADVRQALADPRLSVNDQHPNWPNRLLFPVPPRAVSFWRMDPPEHGAYRKMVAAEFTAHRTQALRPLLQSITDELLDEMAAMPKPVDFHSVFALPLPCIAIARIFGVPDEDMSEFKENTSALLNQKEPEKAVQAFLATTAYLDGLARAKEREPKDDLLSRLVVNFVRPGQLSHDDLVAMVRLMLVAGHETTANQIALSIFTLLDRPGVLAELRADPRLLTPVVDELLRYWSIAQDNVVRTATEDLSVGTPASRPATPSSSLSRAPITTRPSSPTRRTSTSTGTTAAIWPLGTDPTSAPADRWPGPSWRSPSPACSAASPTCVWPSDATRSRSTPTRSCTAWSACR